MAASSLWEREPGAAKYGNFINYYQFNSPKKRINLIPRHLLNYIFSANKVEKLRVGLDIGCNAGDLTEALYQHFTDIENQERIASELEYDLHILGVDLDPVLIKRSCEKNSFPNNITYKEIDIMEGDQCYTTFRSYLNNFGKSMFDIIFCFSVTMWVHLNHGDVGLKKFLKDVSGFTQYLLLEPQEWKCYRSASRRMRKLKCPAFQNLEDLQMKESVVEDIACYLKECGMEEVKNFGTTEWGRKIILYKKIKV
ncbi:pre-miRNA 5'-monophosphate methyltransferase-like [Limulus polyphemus]|uniref:RNA methyltransferase n=1 Tax=Limulus polyphemus TaxID=6850 RepID=A0ABM1B628_LIMPO|nr:pre-miRNA 5'-monophosphate methyltransferase-like [Limulus polyphemus]